MSPFTAYGSSVQPRLPLGAQLRYSFPHRRALRGIQVNRRAIQEVGARSAANYRGDGDSTRPRCELPEQFVDLLEITLREDERLAIMKGEPTLAARHSSEYRKPLFDPQFKAVGPQGGGRGGASEIARAPGALPW